MFRSGLGTLKRGADPRGAGDADSRRLRQDASGLSAERVYPEILKQLEDSGQLAEHLERVGQQALELYETIEAQMMTDKRLPQDYLERVAALESIPHIAEEIVLGDVVHNPTP